MKKPEFYKTTILRAECPHCGALRDILIATHLCPHCKSDDHEQIHSIKSLDDPLPKEMSFRCYGCENIFTEPTIGKYAQCHNCDEYSLTDDWKWKEVTVDAVKCPRCDIKITDTDGNHSFSALEDEPGLVCYNCQMLLRGYLHHETSAGAKIDSTIPETGGYFGVYHKGCPEATETPGESRMLLQRLYVDKGPKDHGSRVVLTYVCMGCGDQQVLKDLLQDNRVFDHDSATEWVHKRKRRRQP